MVWTCEKKSVASPVRRIESLIVEGKRSWGRPKKTWVEQIKNDLSELHLSKDLTRDRNRWRRQSHFQIIISFISCLSCLMSSCCFSAYFVFLPTVLLFCFKIDFLHMAFCACSFTLEAIMSLQILFMQDTFLFGVKLATFL